MTLTTQRVDEGGCERWVWGHRDSHWSNSKEMLHVLYVAAATQTETCPWDKNMRARQREITSSSRYPASCLPMPPPPHPPPPPLPGQQSESKVCLGISVAHAMCSQKLQSHVYGACLPPSQGKQDLWKLCKLNKEKKTSSCLSF